MYHILVVGAGYAGQAIARHFQAKSQKVFAITRNPEKAESLKKKENIIPILADLNKPASLQNIPPAHFIVISCAPDQSDEANYRRTYLEGIGNFLTAIKKNPRPALIVYLSSTGVFGEQKNDWVDETTPPRPDTEKAKILLQAETQVLESGYPSLIFRLAGIYGPTRNRIQAIQEGRWAPEKNYYMNMIHRDDIVNALPVLFNRGEAGNIYLGVDDEPAASRELYAWVSRRLGKNLPAAGPGGEAGDDNAVGKRYRNQRLKALGVKMLYPTFREGYNSLFDGMTH